MRWRAEPVRQSTFFSNRRRELVAQDVAFYQADRESGAGAVLVAGNRRLVEMAKRKSRFAAITIFISAPKAQNSQELKFE